MATEEPLISKYRPQTFDEVIGHDTAIQQLQRHLSQPTRAHCYLLTGEAGIGKTTIARIIGRALEAEPNEIDAASFSGVDATRELVQQALHMSLTGSGRKIYIIDECHRLSANAWDALLKVTEEPPPHLFFAFCTTNPDRVPGTMKTRSYQVALRKVGSNAISDLLALVAEMEEWDIPGPVRQRVVQAAMGSPRQALSYLQVVNGITDPDEVERVIALVDNSDAIRELCQHLIRASSWHVVRELLQRVDDDEFEQASTNMARYFIAAMLNQENNDKAKRCWELLDALVFPSSTFDRKAQFYAAIGRILWA